MFCSDVSTLLHCSNHRGHDAVQQNLHYKNHNAVKVDTYKKQKKKEKKEQPKSGMEFFSKLHSIATCTEFRAKKMLQRLHEQFRVEWVIIEMCVKTKTCSQKQFGCWHLPPSFCIGRD